MTDSERFRLASSFLSTGRRQPWFVRIETQPRKVVDVMFAGGCDAHRSTTYEITHGWRGTHPVNAIPVVIMTPRAPKNPPRGKSKLVFLTSGVHPAVAQAKNAAGKKAVGIGSASVAQQAPNAGFVWMLRVPKDKRPPERRS